MPLNPSLVRTFINEALPPSPVRDAVHASIARAYERNSALYTNWRTPYLMVHYFLPEVLYETFGLSYASAENLTKSLLMEHD